MNERDSSRGQSNDASCLTLSLREIANWQLCPEKISNDQIYATMPSFQRGLVWNAAQIEVLWDSLLRGIPIGSLSLLPIENSEQYVRGETVRRDGYFILDGQQRANAIALGYAAFPDEHEKPHAILWIDLLPSEELRSRSNRRFFFYLTTEGRPWGYVISDVNGENRAGKVSPSEYLPALDGRSAGVRPPIRDLWPVSATLPVPVSLFREWMANSGTDNIFDYLINKKSACGELGWYANLMAKASRADIAGRIVEAAGNARKIAEAFGRVEKMKVLATIAPKELSVDMTSAGKSENELERDSEIAVYFARLNRGGTLPSREDLNYSILKAANPALGRIDDFAKNRMHPSRMAQYAVLAYKSLDQGKIIFSVSRRDAYRLGSDPKFETGLVAFQNAVKRVDDWLLYKGGDDCGLLPVLRTRLAFNRPRLYLFLILLAHRGVEVSREWIIALTMLLAWFGDGERLDFGTCYEEFLKQRDANGVRASVQQWLYSQVGAGALVLPVPMSVMDGLVEALAAPVPIDMEIVRKAWNPRGYQNAFNRIWYWDGAEARGLLLYACRKYMDKEFHSYDPASMVWNEDNRPWDYDHIIPRNWLVYRQGRSHGKHHELVAEFLNCIGNIAPLPFSMNRAKHDAAPGAHYMESEERRRLVFVKEESLKEVFFTRNCQWQLEKSDSLAYRFALITSMRFRDIYRVWIEQPALQQLLDFSGACKSRRDMADAVKARLAHLGCLFVRVVFVAEDGFQFDVQTDADWARPWIACGANAAYHREDGEKTNCFACVVEQNGTFEVGLRRSPENNQRFDNDGNWWIESVSKLNIKTLHEALKCFDWVLSHSGVEFR